MPASISLIIPAYNRAHLISETIDSALSQIQRFCEIIVVDDGSTDDTAAVLGGYGDRIRVVHTSNRGVQAARNLGVETATSEYVTFCDSDDLLEPEFVSTISGWLSKKPDCDAVYINFRKFNATSINQDDLSQAPPHFLEGAKLSGDFLYEIPDVYPQMFTVNPFYITGCTVKKEFYNSIGGFDTQFNGLGAEDSEFTLRAVAAGKVAFCKTSLGRVRRHSGNQSANAMHVMLGSAAILEYASKHHSNAVRYRSVLIDAAQKLRIAVADKTFANGEFVRAKPLFQHKFQRPVGLKFHMKRLIVNLPEPLRSAAWKITQAC